jgi:hypothetical protein
VLLLTDCTVSCGSNGVDWNIENAVQPNYAASFSSQLTPSISLPIHHHPLLHILPANSAIN